MHIDAFILILWLTLGAAIGSAGTAIAISIVTQRKMRRLERDTWATARTYYRHRYLSE
jgi:Na+/phosphate symporter